MNLGENEDIYSEITIKTVKPFKMGRYVMVTPNPEDDVNAYMEHGQGNPDFLITNRMQ
ncbi:MAG: hypothetical protein J6D08_16990 [Lachnospiraceae bacterium]|nr:hypothetical protein [Lachnospiraceae bacterium]